MLIKVNSRIINTAHIVSASFGVGSDKAKLQIHFVNNVTPGSALGTTTLEGEEAERVWKELSKESVDVSPK
jgi:hypothetical protein